MKNITALFLTAALIFSVCTGTCFADTSTVPVHINVAESKVSFAVTEKITMTASAGSPELIIEDLVIENTGSMGQISLDSLSVTAENGWSLVVKDTDFVNMSANAKKFSLISGSTDFAEAGASYPAEKAKVGGSITVEFEGKTGASTEAVSDMQVAEIVATISLV